MTRYSIEPNTRKYVKGYEFLSFARQYKKQLLDAVHLDFYHLQETIKNYYWIQDLMLPKK